MRAVRSRYVAAIDPELRQIREGVGLSFDDAVSVLGEGRHLLSTQEAGPADAGFAWSTTHKYLDWAMAAARARTFPSMNDVRGATRLEWLRKGLGVTPADCAKILRLSMAETTLLLDGRRPLPDSMRQNAWVGLTSWGRRRMRRMETRQEIVAKLAGQRRSVAGFTPEQLAALELEATSGRRSKARVEADVMRLLGAPPAPRRSNGFR